VITISWYSPKPKQKPKRLPRRRPIKTVPSGIGDEGIVANWLFYYLKGGDHLHDFSPKDNHGALNGPVWKDGQYGWALEFDGADDYIDVGDYDVYDVGPNDTITLAAWVKVPSDVSSDAGIIHKYDASYYGYALEVNDVDNDGSYEVQLWLRDAAANVYKAQSSTAVDDGVWHYVVGVISDTDQLIYVDGSQEDSLARGGDHSNANSLTMGYEDSVDKGWYYGTIAIVRIYSVAKSASWIKRRFERTRGIFGI